MNIQRRLRLRSFVASLSRLVVVALTASGACGGATSEVPATMHVVPAAPAPARSDLATVVFIAPADPEQAAAPPMSIAESTGEIYGQLPSGSYFFSMLPPGPHTFVGWVDLHNRRSADAVQATLAPGRIYYIVVLATWQPHTQFIAIHPGTQNRARVERWLHESRRLEPNPGLLASLQANEQRRWQRLIGQGVERLARYADTSLEEHTLTAEQGEQAVAAAPASQLDPPAPAAAPRTECPTGQTITADTAGHCCWPGQAWAPSRGICVGTPECAPPLHARREACVR